MAKEFTYKQSFGSDPVAVFTMLRAPEYVQAKCAATGSLKTTIDVTESADGSVTITSTRVLTAEVPAGAELLIMAVMASVVAVWIHDDRLLTSRIGPFLALLLVLIGMAHIAVRLLARGADGTLLPLVVLLHGLGYVMISRLDDELAGLQALWSLVAIVAFA
ncbi:MAG: DUF2505 family protein, partial [Candidatus Nanopelagicales bacterium]